MRKTITITDPIQVKPGDEAYFKDCDFGFTVTGVDADDERSPIAVYNPLSGLNYWVDLSRFSHATREVKEPEWPHPDDNEMHVYLGADGVKYLYMPSSDVDVTPWIRLPLYDYHNKWSEDEEMARDFPEALPLTELELVTKDAKK